MTKIEEMGIELARRIVAFEEVEQEIKRWEDMRQEHQKEIGILTKKLMEMGSPGGEKKS